MRLSDSEVEAIRALLEEGMPASAVARRYSVTAKHVREIGAGRARAMVETPMARGEVLAELDVFLASLALDERGRVLAASARVLAEQIDRVRASSSVASAASLARLVERLADTIEQLERQDTIPDFVDELVARRRARLASYPQPHRTRAR